MLVKEILAMPRRETSLFHQHASPAAPITARARKYVCALLKLVQCLPPRGTWQRVNLTTPRPGTAHATAALLA